jgi:hypothetical protein
VYHPKDPAEAAAWRAKYGNNQLGAKAKEKHGSKTLDELVKLMDR